MALRLALGHIDEFDDSVAIFAQQLGLTGVQFHTPANLPGTPGYWTVDELAALVRHCDSYGLVVEGLENVPLWHWDKVLFGLPGRDEQLENYQRTVRNLAAVGIGVLGHHFMPGYVWRTDLRAAGRGGALVTAFDLARVPATGNALAAYKLAPAGVDATISPDQVWANYQVFLESVLPVAEEVGVRLALHPDDPPVDEPLGGIARVFTSPDGLKRAYELSGGSSAWGLNLCLGTVSEMDGERSVNEVIDFFGPLGRIAYVHFRDVQGTVPAFTECFLGEGNYHPAQVIRRLADNGFDGFVIDDHVPAMIGDPDTWADTSPEAYNSRARAHAIGYLQGILHTLDLDGQGRSSR
ncbi:mannonate dehydratase [Jiangella sp. DSM 45060]|uniref:mannonate dehydratase n=1 Tax=Jiangella sp. DSM 45060 TaxID=1798224 RepID=UPI00087AE954|nr:mannonate dehydratase [Jiangella sp. DSM 45060]SDT46814.1 D-mannonate dehydratase [Jiangella sp. DSM 45060]